MSNLLHIRSVYNKAYYGIYLTSLNSMRQLDLNLIPSQFIENGQLKSESEIINIFNELVCTEEVLISRLISFYNQCQLAFNYVSYEKCGCPYLITWNTYGSIANGRVTFHQLHDMYVFMHDTRSNMARLLKVVLQIQKYLYSNYKNTTACLNKNSYRTFFRTTSNITYV